MAIQVMVNDSDQFGQVTGRKIIIAEQLKQNKKTVLVRLSDGNHIVRRIKRDIDPV